MANLNPSRAGLAICGFWLAAFVFLGAGALHTYLTSTRVGLAAGLPDFKVKSLRFYEAGKDNLPPSKRIYQIVFSQRHSRFICWQIDLEYSPRNYPVQFAISTVIYRVGAGVYVRGNDTFQIEPNWTRSCHAIGWGNRRAGTWPLGTYVVELTTDGKLLAKEEFTVE